jgi:hypothetical protein
VRSITFPITPGAPRLAVWCDEHYLPHKVVRDIYTLCEDGPHRLGSVSECRL